jgi:hypothetical protein
MKQITFSLILLLSSLFTSAQAAQPAATELEIGQLFTALETSNCQFNRNGTWYSAKEASAHLQTKYKYLQDKNLAPTAEKFIERAATESSYSGKNYVMSCSGKEMQASGPWLLAVLAKYRAGIKK